MTNSDAQRLQQLKALTQTPHDAAPLRRQESGPALASMVRSVKERLAENPPESEPDEGHHTPLSASERSPAQPESDPVFSAPRSTLPQVSIPFAPQAQAPRRAPSPELARRGEQTASETIQLRDQREFKLTLVEAASRDDALVARLAEQTVDLVQQRDEMIFQRVMQAIEQRLANSQGAFG
ncbi:hypothetical protein [Bremerella alba]|uniref:Uncharacterized protein n=1 Tax=Bremerella alba TaxID=980252 RepID=A0A7V8V883_9BACT|nr:hypothetical protein [Bremerella alba]MBA2116787.1 hypothetical protein [Bremerella alba]